MRLTTTNLEIGITATVRGKVEKGGKLTVNARLFTDIVHLAPSEQIELTTEGQTLIIHSGETESKLKGLPAEDFPILPKVDSATTYAIPSGVFAPAAQQVVFAAAQDESRPELSGVLFSFGEGGLTLAATDSYRLAEKKVPLAEQAASRRVILPGRSVNEALRILETGEAELTLVIGENQALFRMGDAELITRTIEGQYPDYAQIIPKEHATSAVIESAKLTAAVRAANLFCKPGSNDITFAFDPKKRELSVSATNPQLGEHVGRLKAEVEGSPATIVFNGRYILDGLASLGGDAVRFVLMNEASPGVLRGEGQEDYLYLVMPIRQ